MPVFSGSASGSILQVANNIPSGVMSFSIVNKTGGAVTVNLYVRSDEGDVPIVPYNLSLDAGDSLQSDASIKILVGTSLFLTTTGEVGYYFSID